MTLTIAGCFHVDSMRVCVDRYEGPADVNLAATYESWMDPVASDSRLAHIGGVLKDHGVDALVATGTFKRAVHGRGGHVYAMEATVLACAANVAAIKAHDRAEANAADEVKMEKVATGAGHHASATAPKSPPTVKGRGKRAKSSDKNPSAMKRRSAKPANGPTTPATTQPAATPGATPNASAGGGSTRRLSGLATVAAARWTHHVWAPYDNNDGTTIYCKAVLDAEPKHDSAKNVDGKWLATKVVVTTTKHKLKWLDEPGKHLELTAGTTIALRGAKLNLGDHLRSNFTCEEWP